MAGLHRHCSIDNGGMFTRYLNSQIVFFLLAFGLPTLTQAQVESIDLTAVKAEICQRLIEGRFRDLQSADAYSVATYHSRSPYAVARMVLGETNLPITSNDLSSFIRYLNRNSSGFAIEARSAETACHLSKRVADRPSFESESLREGFFIDRYALDQGTPYKVYKLASTFEYFGSFPFRNSHRLYECGDNFADTRGYPINRRMINLINRCVRED